ncbi:MAG: cation transporter [Microscillaceae bacterium]|nr:cation transporter [Microscillaceae bacterium]MDW8461035.1 heavy metal-associated domain-containing protein [Cytophagales bacterium]
MKVFVSLIIFILFFFTFSFQTQAQSGKGKGKAKGNQQISIKTSAQCEMCKNRIEKALKSTKGIKKANLDLNTKAVNVTFNSNQIDAEAIRKVISNTGYDADDIPADQKAYDALPSCCKKK